MENIIPIPALKDNYIWMLQNFKLKKAWVVDPGDAKPVLEALEQYQLTLTGIFLTHHHFDHSNGIPELLDHFSGIPVVGSYKSPNRYISHSVKENDEVDCFNQKFKVIEIPGHTLDHVAYYGNLNLFCGDTLFSAGCGRIFEGTPQMMCAALKKLQALDEGTKIYCGHEYTLANLYFAKTVELNNRDIQRKIADIKNASPSITCSLPSVLSEEKKINPFLRCHVPEVKQAVENFLGKELADPVEVFRCLRGWKDGFVVDEK